MPQINGAILPEPDAQWISLEADGWTPSAADVASAEPAVLARIRADAPALLDRLSEYRCQYIGYAIAGRRRIYCNFFRDDPQEPEPDWRTRPVFVLDGGDDYFHAIYDVAAGRCVAFHVNGEA